MTDNPVLSIVIVNYNGGRLIENCLNSIIQHPASRETEIIVVDNASADDSLGRVERTYPAARLVRNQANVGLAKAFNQGLQIARGRFLLSLDNDTRVLPGALDALVAFMIEHADVGAVGSRLYNPDMTAQQTARRVPSAINAIFGRRSLVTRLFPSNPLSRRYLMAEQREAVDSFEVGWMSTAALMVRREVLDAVGGLDEAFFVYWVDADWCARIRRAGWKIFCVPASRIIHDENLVGRGRRSPRRARMVVDFHRGAYRYYRKNHARSPWNPMALLALLGLSVRAATIITVDRLKALRQS